VFKRLEDFPEGDPAVRGSGGPIHCTRLDNFDPLSEAFLAACGEAGYQRVADYNDGHYEGAFNLQYTTRNGLRNSASVGYLRPAKNRPNLTILTNATATRVLLMMLRKAVVNTPAKQAVIPGFRQSVPGMGVLG
jgi:choline dehydrogenase